ncbi:MAG: TetR-like C-terminal domain-containing protein [archaeon]
MANIIHDNTGPNYQVPGLPYNSPFELVRPIILDDVPTKEEIENILSFADKKTLTNAWSLQAIKGFKDYIPTTFKRVTQEMDPVLFEEYFGMKADWVPESERVLLQLQTEIEAKAATIDAAIVHSRMELGTVVNKAHIANRLYNIGQIYNHLEKRDYPFLFGDLTDKTSWVDALSDMKLQFIEYMKEIPVGPRKYPIKIRTTNVSQEEIDKDYPFVEWFKQKLGDNFLGDLLYGSASRTKDPAQFSDYDNWVLVKDVKKAHEVLRGTEPSVLDGKVVEHYHGKDANAKHLGIHLFPNDQQYIINHIRFLHDSKEFRTHTKLLYGEFPFPKVAMDEVVERGVSHAYTKLKTIAGSLNWAWYEPTAIIGKPNLFEFIVKNMRFFLQHSLNATGRPTFRNKQTLNELLTKRNLKIPEYKEDISYIKDSLVYSLVGVLQLQKELFEKNRKPRLNFLVEESIPDPKEILDWNQLDD